MNGFATLTLNMFRGNRPHELSITITTGGLGDIRRIAVSSREEAQAKCAEFKVTLA